MIDGAVAVGGSQDAERDRQHHGQHEGGSGELGGGRPEVLEHHAHGRPALAQRQPEVAERCGADELGVLHPQRAVEAERVTGPRHLLAGGAGVHEQRGRVAGEADQEEDDGDDAPDDEDGVQQPP